MDENERQHVIDEEHLRLLSIANFVSAGIAALFSLFGLIWGLFAFFLFSTAIQQAAASSGEAPPLFVRWFFLLFGLGFTVILLAMAALKYHTARCLTRHRSRVLCMVVAAISCLEIPYGTLLGIWTFSVLSRPCVVQLFEPAEPRPK